MLISENACRLELLVVVNPEDVGAESRPLGNEPPTLWRKITCPGVAERPVGLKHFQVAGTNSPRDSIELRIVPCDWKRNGRVQQSAEVVSAMRVLPKVIHIDQQPFAD